MLSELYSLRKDKLEADGIYPTKELLLAVYGIEQKRLKAGSDFGKPLLSAAQPKLAAGKGTSEKAEKPAVSPEKPKSKKKKDK